MGFFPENFPFSLMYDKEHGAHQNKQGSERDYGKSVAAGWGLTI